VSALLELGSGFNPEFTGRENVYMNGAILGLSPREIDERFDEIASFADIGEFLEQPVKTYSSGMMMRLAFSVATCVQPDILIVDEALSVGDILFQHRCMDRIRKLCDNGTTLLFVSHAPDALRALCQRAVWLEQGKLRMLGAARDVADEYMRSFHMQRNASVVDAVRAEAPQSDDFFTPLDAAAQSLDGGDVIDVEQVRILNARGEPTDHVPIDERFALEVSLRARRDLTHVSVGFVIKNEHGVELTGESVFNALRRSLALKAGELRTIRFSAVNNLRGGHYSVAVRVHHVSRWDRSDAVLLYSDDVAIAFHVSQDPGEPMWFLYRHPFEVSIS
jgi:lipopolysaccharide transport system ATP-binding protein